MTRYVVDFEGGIYGPFSSRTAAQSAMQKVKQARRARSSLRYEIVQLEAPKDLR